MIKLKYLLIVYLMLILTACVSAPDKKENPYLLERAESYMASGVEYYQHYEYLSARAQFTKALYEYQGFNYVAGIARCRLNLAKLAIALGEYDEADKNLKLARQIIDDNKLSELTILADIMSSSMAIQLKNYASALAYLEPYLSDMNAVKNRDAAIYIAVILNRVRVAFGLGDEQKKWMDRFYQAIDKNDPGYRARWLRFQAELASLNNEYADSERWLMQALELYRQQANPKGVSSALQALGAIKLKKQDWHGAADDYENALLASFKIKDKSTVLEILDVLSGLYLKLDKTVNKKKVDHLKSVITEKNKNLWYVMPVPGI